MYTYIIGLFYSQICTYPIGPLNHPLTNLGSDYKLCLYKCHTPASLSTCSWGWGLPTPGCLCKALPNIEQILRPTCVWQNMILKLLVFSDDRPSMRPWPRKRGRGGFETWIRNLPCEIETRPLKNGASMACGSSRANVCEKHSF